MLRIAVQAKGRLFEETMALLGESDIKLSTTKRTLLVQSSNFPIEVLFLRDDDIPQTVATGVADLGIVGENEFMEKEDIETAYGVSGMVKEKRDAYHSPYVTQLVIGITCCICSVIPLFGTLAVSESDFYMVSAVCMLLTLVAIGTYFIVRSAAKMNADQPASCGHPEE